MTNTGLHEEESGTPVSTLPPPRLPAARRVSARLRGLASSPLLPLALAALVVAFGAALRLDALTDRYGLVESPGWVRLAQTACAHAVPHLRPASLRGVPEPVYPHPDGPPTRYFSDPYTYLKFARQMPFFYGAHYREPVFPFATKVMLRVFANQDVAVSFASLLFSVLAIAATFFLGSAAFSRWVGLGAAAAMAIEYDLVSLGVSGCRDDAFMFAVVLCAWTVLMYVGSPTRARAAAVGASAALACLVRITALSFVVPAFVALLFAGAKTSRTRFARVGLAFATLALLAGPYVFNCWRVFGDPLYAINYHTGNYLAVEGRTVESRPNVAQYVEGRVRDRPFRTIDTIAIGLTSYPFSNKWRGFDAWMPHLGEWLAWLSLVGLAVFLVETRGRFILLILATALLPYAVTWKLSADWRFTEHAYPFFLVASCVPIGVLAQLATRAYWRAPLLSDTSRRALLSGAFALTFVAAATWAVVRVLPVLVVREALAYEEDVSIVAGERDGSFFDAGWSPVATDGVPARTASASTVALRIPLPRVADYSVTIRLDPVPRPSPRALSTGPPIAVRLNGRPVADLRLSWNPERMGAYDIALPRALVQKGFNCLELARGAGSGPQAANASFRVWYVRVHPPR